MLLMLYERQNKKHEQQQRDAKLAEQARGVARNHPLTDYQMQLMLLEQPKKKKRLIEDAERVMAV